MGNYKKLKGTEKQKALQRIEKECEEVIKKHEKTPLLFPKSQTIESACYTRLSTEDHLIGSDSIISQIEFGITQAKNKSLKEKKNYKISKFFIEKGISGRTDNRPEFIKLKDAIKNDEVKCVFVKELPRIARNTILVKEFFNLAHKHQCLIEIPGFPADPNDPASILFIDMFAALGEFESNTTSRRSRQNIHTSLLNRGKQNQTLPFLGLDPLTVNGQKKPGLYQVNKTEIKTVEKIMKLFNRYRSYQETLRKCEEKGYLNKGNIPFTKHTLSTLLSNKRYIGKWAINERNKDKDQSLLSDFDKHHEVDLPHGCVIDIELWNEVQETREQIQKKTNRNGRSHRIYPLSSLILTEKGNQFIGSSGTSRTGSRHFYYKCPKDKITLNAEMIEERAKDILADIISKTPNMISSINSFLGDVDSNQKEISNLIKENKDRLENIKKEKMKLDRRLDFLLEDADEKEIKEFKSEYKKEDKRIKEELFRCKEYIKTLEETYNKNKVNNFTLKPIQDVAKKAIQSIEENDPTALKAVYRLLFEQIIVSDLNNEGVRALHT